MNEIVAIKKVQHKFIWSYACSHSNRFCWELTANNEFATLNCVNKWFFILARRKCFSNWFYIIHKNLLKFIIIFETRLWWPEKKTENIVNRYDVIFLLIFLVKAYFNSVSNLSVQFKLEHAFCCKTFVLIFLDSSRRINNSHRHVPCFILFK